jgi:hypothetical protein
VSHIRTVFMVYEKEPETGAFLEKIKSLFANRQHARNFVAELQQHAPPGTEFITVPLILQERKK